MAKIEKKYEDHFNQLIKDWNSLKSNYDRKNFTKVLQDLEMIQKELHNLKF